MRLKKNLNWPDEIDEVSLWIWDMFPGLQGVKLAHKLR